MAARQDRCRFATRESNGEIYVCPLVELHDEDHIMVPVKEDEEITVLTITAVITSLTKDQISRNLMAGADLIINTEEPSVIKNRCLPGLKVVDSYTIVSE